MASIGRRYEEACQSMLRLIGISLRHVGGRSDGGVDLTGYWHLEEPPHPIIVQCKYIRRDCPPMYVRELEGVVAREKDTVAVLVSSSPASRASIETLAQSPWPMLFLHYDMVKLRKAFANTSLQRRLPRLIVGSKHVDGDVEPAFFYG